MDAATTQVFSHLAAGAMKPCFDRTNRAAHHLGDLFVREILFVEHREHETVFGPELLEGFGQLASQVVRVPLRRSVINRIVHRVHHR